MANTYRLQVITPERILLDDQVQQTTAPGADGYLGVLAHHAPLITTLLPGEVRVTLADGRTTSHIVIGGGVLEVSADGSVILADNAERSDEIDMTRAEADLIEARRMISDLAPGSAESRAAIVSAQHAEARIRAAQTNR